MAGMTLRTQAIWDQRLVNWVVSNDRIYKYMDVVLDEISTAPFREPHTRRLLIICIIKRYYTPPTDPSRKRTQE